MAKWKNWLIFGSLGLILLVHLLLMFFTLNAAMYKFHNISVIVLCILALFGILAKKW